VERGQVPGSLEANTLQGFFGLVAAVVFDVAPSDYLPLIEEIQAAGLLPQWCHRGVMVCRSQLADLAGALNVDDAFLLDCFDLDADEWWQWAIGCVRGGTEAHRCLTAALENGDDGLVELLTGLIGVSAALIMESGDLMGLSVDEILAGIGAELAAHEVRTGGRA
jgi:hypothetical protein